MNRNSLIEQRSALLEALNEIRKTAEQYIDLVDTPASLDFKATMQNMWLTADAALDTVETRMLVETAGAKHG